MKLLFACAISSPFGGNFIPSIMAIEKEMKVRGYETVFAFPIEAKSRKWCQTIAENHVVYYLPTAKARIKPKTYATFQRIYRENPDICIAHSHYELYDIPMTVTAPKNVKVFWHLHDTIVHEKENKGFRGLLWNVQYGLVGRRAFLISVSEKHMNEINKFGFPSDQAVVLQNGIDLDRIQQSMNTNKPYDFLIFGWDFYRKGGDILIEAGKRLRDEGYQFKILFNGQNMTWDKMDRYLKGENCPFIVRGEPANDINVLYDECTVLISASRAETFSYAIAEAAYAGLPVISSDIDGVQWAKALPTVDFFPSEDIEALYFLMKKYLDGKRTSDDSIAESRRIIEAKYSVDHWTEKVVEIYDI